MGRRGKPKLEHTLDDGTLQDVVEKASTTGLDLNDCLTILGCTKLCDGDLYSKTCKWRRENPNCLHTLVPAPDAWRKKGLWQRNLDELLDLGTDPNTQLKKVGTTLCVNRAFSLASMATSSCCIPSHQDPRALCGLRNLGNTCYVNSVLQVLFLLRQFRFTVLSLEEEIGVLPIVYQLR